MFCTILLELFLPFRPFKETTNNRWTIISAQILHMRNLPFCFVLKRKLGAAAKQSINQTADCTAQQSD